MPNLKSFPCKCASCRERAVRPVTLDSYTADLDHDGRTYTVTVKNLDVLQCERCAKQVIPDDSFDRLTADLRRQAGLLSPEEIKQNRDRLHLTQKALAEYLRVSVSTLCRWETGGQIQQRAMDLLLRAFFHVPDVRKWLDTLRNPSMSLYSYVNMASNNAAQFSQASLICLGQDFVPSDPVTIRG
jgi:putative zinc finger/helix-turn-helix YgiT family protein